MCRGIVRQINQFLLIVFAVNILNQESCLLSRVLTPHYIWADQPICTQPHDYKSHCLLPKEIHDQSLASYYKCTVYVDMNSIWTQQAGFLLLAFIANQTQPSYTLLHPCSTFLKGQRESNANVNSCYSHFRFHREQLRFNTTACLSRQQEIFKETSCD